jgi:hypothetical protein
MPPMGDPSVREPSAGRVLAVPSLWVHGRRVNRADYLRGPVPGGQQPRGYRA